MKKHSLRYNYILNMIPQILSVLTPIITMPYVSRVLGSNSIGIIGFTGSIISYFTLACTIGLTTHGQLEIAYNQDDREKRSQVFWEILAFRILLTLLVTMVYVIMFCVNRDLSSTYRLLIINLVSSCLNISFLYTGVEDFTKPVMKNIIVRLVCVVLTFVFINDPGDYNLYIIIHSGMDLLMTLSFFIGIGKIVDLPKRKLHLFRHLKPSLILFLPQIAISVYTLLDKTMLGRLLLDMNEVGYYEQGEKVVKTLLTLLTAIGSVLVPRIASCIASKDYDQIKGYFNKVFKLIFLLGLPMMLGIIAVAHNFVPVYFGPGFEKVPYIMICLSPIIIFISISSALGSYLIPAKKMKTYNLAVFSGAIINFIFNFVMIPYIKSYGAAIATALAEGIIMTVELIATRKVLNFKESLKSSYKYFISAIIMFIVCFLVDQLALSQLVTLIIQISSGIVVYFGVLLILKDEFLLEMLDIVLVKLKIKKIKPTE